MWVRDSAVTFWFIEEAERKTDGVAISKIALVSPLLARSQYVTYRRLLLVEHFGLAGDHDEATKILY